MTPLPAAAGGNQTATQQSGCGLKRRRPLNQLPAGQNQIEAQRSGFDLERRRDGMSEFCPAGGTNDMQSTPTWFHVKHHRKNRKAVENLPFRWYNKSV